MASNAVSAAQARRASASNKDEWFIQQVVDAVNLTLHQRLTVSMQYLRDKTVKNISIPVVKMNGAVTQRSVPGEFPRADTTLLMKSIFADVKGERNQLDGYVYTPVPYSIPLELTMDRRFLTRTLHEELNNIRRMLLVPIK